jgi:Uma2 family endonuclease
MMNVTVTLDPATTTLPRKVPKSLAEFRKWAESDALPEKTRIDFYRGEVWIDMGGEQVFSHGLLKSQFGTVLTLLSESEVPGFYSTNGILVTNEGADLSGNPDGTFLSTETIERGRLTFTHGRRGGLTEVVGSADMVLEVVSPGSVYKDTERLREAYYEAGVLEYWIADGRGENPVFLILKRGPRGYTEVRRVGGWLKSGVYGRAFRLRSIPGPGGHPRYQLEHK